MADTDLLTPRVKGHSTWTILAGLTAYLAVGVWQVTQERFLSRDNVELSFLDITISTCCIYYGAVATLRLCSAGVFAFIKKYGLKPSLIYLGFVSVLSYILVAWLMDAATLEAGRWLQNSIVRRLESSVVEIAETRPPIKHTYTTDDFPYTIEEHTKYMGEDAVFECVRIVSHKADIHPTNDQIVWVKDGEIVRSSERIKIVWTFENVTDATNENDGLKHYVFTSSLTLTFIERGDFGNYSCYLKNTVLLKFPANKPPPKRDQPMCPLVPPPPCWCNPPNPQRPPSALPKLPKLPTPNFNTQYHIVQLFGLVPMPEKTRVIYAPPGGLVSFTATYDNIDDLDEVSFGYTVGGDPFDSVCQGMLEGCSWLVKIYWVLFHNGGHTETFTATVGSVRMQTAVTGTGWQCMCKKAYNYHEFWFSRTFYNVTSGRKELREYRYPHRVIIAPRTPDLFFYNFTNKVDPLAKEPCWVGPQKQLLVGYCKQEQEMLDWTLWVLFRLEATCIIIVAVGCLVVGGGASWLLTKTVVVPVRNRILEGSFNPCKGCVKTDSKLGCISDDEGLAVKHDIFISHAEQELSMGYQLAQLLESSGLKVFLPDRDVLIGRLKTEAVSAAISSSKLFVVILTKEYIKNGLKNRFEFQLILNKVYKDTIYYKRLLLVKRDGVSVPNILNNFCMLDWTRNDDIDFKCRRLTNWSKGKANKNYICIC